MQNEAYGWVSLLLLALVTAHENHGCSQLWTEVEEVPLGALSMSFSLSSRSEG